MNTSKMIKVCCDKIVLNTTPQYFRDGKRFGDKMPYIIVYSDSMLLLPRRTGHEPTCTRESHSTADYSEYADKINTLHISVFYAVTAYCAHTNIQRYTMHRLQAPTCLSCAVMHYICLKRIALIGNTFSIATQLLWKATKDTLRVMNYSQSSTPLSF